MPLPVIGRPSGRVNRLLERWLPESWRRARLDPGRRAAAALAVVALAAAVVAAIGVWRARPVTVAAPGLPEVVAAPVSSAAPVARDDGGPLVVSVVGKVRRPGLVTVPAGSRVADAIGKAGGPLRGADLTPLNLARRLADGEQIAVGVPGPAAEPAPVVGTGAGPGPPATPGAKVDLNRATVAQLDGLPGVGPVTAQRIVDWRTAHGRFTSVQQLRQVPGIGERRFTQLQALVTV
jgi:competence protein ComEA